MNYEEIYSQFYTKQIDPDFFKKHSKTEAYELMRDWLHSTVGMPHVRKCFSVIALDDEILELTYELVDSIDDDSDMFFVRDILAQGMVICWMQQKIDKAVNLATVIGGKEEKIILNNYKNNMERLNKLELKLKKAIRDHEYYNGDIGEE